VKSVFETDISQSKLVINPNSASRFSFVIDVTEDEFSRYVGNDSAFCLDHIELNWFVRQNTSKSVEQAHQKGLSFVVSAYPDMVQRIRKMPGKLSSAKDCFLFCPYEQPDFVVINKPTSLLTILSPTNSVPLLEGLIHRVDVVCQVGKYDLGNGKIFLSSDKVMASSEGSGDDAIFWSPDVQYLLKNHNKESFNNQGDVMFYPFVLNSSQQPATPLMLTCSLPAHSTFVIPLFLRIKRSDKQLINIKLLVDFIPLGVLKSSMVKELQIQIQPLRPMAVDFTVSALDHRDQYHFNGPAILPNSVNILSAHVRCTHALSSGSISIDDSTFKNTSAVVQYGESGQIEYLNMSSCNNCRSCVLKTHENYIATLPFRYNILNNYINVGSVKVQTTVFPGVLELRWHVTGMNPLKFAPPVLDGVQVDREKLVKCGFFERNCSDYDWLLYGCSTQEVLNGTDRGLVVADAVSVVTNAVTRFPVPALQVRHLADLVLSCLSCILYGF
jgi:hypothetical protein